MPPELIVVAFPGVWKFKPHWISDMVLHDSPYLIRTSWKAWVPTVLVHTAPTPNFHAHSEATCVVVASGDLNKGLLQRAKTWFQEILSP